MISNVVPVVSVIIPVFNGEKFLPETIQSVLNQTVPDFEILIVDDGSTDGTAMIIEDYAKRDNRIYSLKQKNSGVSAARNFGYTKARGQVIAFLDADDMWLPDNLETKLEKLLNTNFGLVHSDAAVISAPGQLTGQTMCGHQGNLLNDILAWRETQVPGPSSILVKREVLERVGLFDEQLSTSADQDFFIRVAAHFGIGRVDKITWHYRVHNNNMHKNITRMEHDVLLVFDKARRASFFSDKKFEKDCFTNMYLILAASWAGNGKNWWRAFCLITHALAIKPTIIFKLLARVWKWMLGKGK